MGDLMDNATTKRRHKRVKMVLPLKIWSADVSDHAFKELAHTLDITPTGARLGAIRHLLKPGEILTIQYRQRRFQCRVVWVRQLEGTTEYQVGVEAIGGGETWGIELKEQEMAELVISKVGMTGHVVVG
jgi:PilZ domain-containing protein